MGVKYISLWVLICIFPAGYSSRATSSLPWSVTFEMRWISSHRADVVTRRHWAVVREGSGGHGARGEMWKRESDGI